VRSRTRSISLLPAEVAGEFTRTLEETPPQLETAEIGTVASVSRGIAQVVGFTDVAVNEHIRIAGGIDAIAASIRRHETGLILLGSSGGLRTGDHVYRTHEAMTTLVGHDLLGRTVDPLGRPLDGAPPPRRTASRFIESRAPDIIDRAPVSEPLQTGIKAIDATIPIGRGQRELILGDRQTGKTAIAVAALANQRHSGVIGIYCAIGQRSAATARVIRTLSQAGVRSSSIVIATSGEDPPGLQFIAPYAATAMAEYFMHQGRDVLLVYDDLTRHARAYRELSLLLRRPPGREAYPGDIFYIHARLLERATKLREAKGGGSITALPVVETQAGNISAYIPTNLISITDGQVYLSPDLFQRGVLPAIDIGRSVSRVGGKAQLPPYRAVARSLKLAYAQFEEIEAFARFATRLDDETRRTIERGRRVREILKQDEQDLLGVPEQIAVLLAATEGMLDAVPIGEVRRAEISIRETVRSDQQSRGYLSAKSPLDDGRRAHVMGVVRQAIAKLGNFS
jgi:F-type H+-transporting ATPase subunit alpha